MWKCTKCGLELENQDQDHSCPGPPKTIEEYIKSQPENIQMLLNVVKDTISEAMPCAEERISWSMPTFWENRNIIHFAAFKKHIGLYPGPEAVEHFSDSLKDYKTSKGAIRFLYDRPLPLELITEIAKWCYETL